jgi:hypothetical protein
MNVKVKNVVANFKDKITILQTVFEALSNSLEANSTNVKIVFHNALSLPNTTCYDSFSITDNGDGFNKKNRESFLEYLSNYKYQYGCKGVGRFTWLKVFSNVHIHSECEGEKTDINFNLEFDDNNSEHWNVETSDKTEKSSTKIDFQNCILAQNDYVNLDLEDIKQVILNTFAVKLFFLNENNSEFCIEITDDNNKKSLSITKSDLLKLAVLKIHISKESFCKGFKIYYAFTEDGRKNKQIFLCADKRAIDDINKKGKIIGNLPNNDSLLCLIISDYLDESVNDSRTDFVFNKNENEMLGLTKKELEDEIRKHLERIIIERYPSIKESNKAVIQKCIDEYPYLKPFITDDDSIILDEEKVRSNAISKYEKKKQEASEEVSDMLLQPDLDEEELIDGLMTLNDFSNRELAKYFLYRQQIIDCLGKYIDRNEAIEKLLHDLFIPQGECLSNSLQDRLKNNIWLLDDKFMSCSSAFSDIKVKTIRKLIQESDKEDGDDDSIEPDLTIFYSNGAAVVVEFKALGADYNKKIDAISEIDRNNGIVASNIESINSLYGFIITDFDDVFLKRVSKVHGMKRMFDNNDQQMFYYYNENIENAEGKTIPCHTYIISAKTIYYDSFARNKLFIDIIKNADKNE